MDSKHTSGERRKDYVAHLAVVLFCIIMVLELLLVTWLPHQLRSEKLWDRQVAFQEMIDLEDYLRRYIRGSIKFKTRWQEGEAYMALNSLDVLAKYIRTNQQDLTREQIREVYLTLTKFEKHYKNWEKGEYLISFEEIKIEPVLSQQMKAYNEWEKSQDDSSTK